MKLHSLREWQMIQASLERQIKEQAEEIARLRDRTEEQAADLLRLREESERTQKESFDTLRRHIEEDCQRHPMAALREEIARLRAWIGDLQSGMYVNCVYCGHQYGPGETAPVSMADALKAHVEQCPQHPMSALKREIALLRSAGEVMRKAVEELLTEFVSKTRAA